MLQYGIVQKAQFEALLDGTLEIESDSESESESESESDSDVDVESGSSEYEKYSEEERYEQGEIF